MVRLDCLPAHCILRFWLIVACILGCTSTTPAEEPLPLHALTKLGTHQFYHGPGVHAVLSPDGSRIASAARESFYYVTDSEREKYERIIVLWDSTTGERIRELQVPHAPVYQLLFSPDGKQLAAEYGQKDGKAGIALFDVESGKLTTHVGERSRSLPLLTFSADGRSLLFQKGYGEPYVWWDLVNAKQLREWKAPEVPAKLLEDREYVCNTVLSANAKFLAALVDVAPDYSKLPPGVIPPPHVPRPTALVLRDANTNEVLYRKVFPAGALERFVFAADGHYFATGGDKITVYETATGKDVFALNAKSTYSFSLSSDGQWAVIATGASEVRLWNLQTKKPAHEFFSGLTYISSRYGSQVFSGDGNTLLFVDRSSLRVFDTKTGKERLSPRHHSRITPRFSTDGRTLFTTCDEFRQTWNISSLNKPTLLKSEPRKSWEGVCGNQAAGHSPDGRLFVDEGNRRMRIRDTATGRVLHTLADDGRSGHFAVFSPDGNRVALRRYASDGKEPEVLGLYDTSTGKKTGDISLKNGLSWVVPAFSDNGKMLAWTDRANDTHLHDAVTGKKIRTFHSEKELPLTECEDADVLLSPGGEYLIVTTYRHELFRRPDNASYWITCPTRVFHVASGREVGRFCSNPQTTTKGLRLTCAANSPDGKLLAVAEKESGTIRLLEITTGKVRAEFVGHRHGVHAMTFSPNGKTLASGGEDGVVFLWDVNS